MVEKQTELDLERQMLKKMGFRNHTSKAARNTAKGTLFDGIFKQEVHKSFGMRKRTEASPAYSNLANEYATRSHKREAWEQQNSLQTSVAFKKEIEEPDKRRAAIEAK